MSAGVALYVRLVSCLALAINFVDRRKDLFQKARLQARVYDSLLRPVGRRGNFSLRFLGERFRTPWLPMFRTQLRAIFVEDLFERNDGSSEVHLAVDAGANVGVATIGILLRHHPTRLIALEADPELYSEYLKPNLEPWRNCGTEIVHLNKALWTHSGSVSFLSTGLDDGQVVTSRGPVELHAQSSVKQLEVASLSLGDLVEVFGASQPIDFMKMDIEGSELPILASLRDSSLVTFLGIEVELTGAKFEAFIDTLSALKRLGYCLILDAQASNSWKTVVSDSAISSYVWIRAFR